MTTHRREAVSTSAEKTGERTRRFVISDESVDRYNTTFAANGWETRNFEANPVLLWCHQASALPLGKATVSRSGSQLIGDFEFFTDDINPDAGRVLKMIDAGVLAASHRFEPIEEEYNPERERGDWRDYVYPPIDYKRQELLEVSVVTVPGNANALPQRGDLDADDLRLVAQAALLRSAEQPEPRANLKALREAALAKRAAQAQRAAPAETAPAEPPAPAVPSEPPLDEQELELPEGMDPESVNRLVKEVVAEVLDQHGRAAQLRRRGELEVSEGA